MRISIVMWYLRHLAEQRGKMMQPRVVHVLCLTCDPTSRPACPAKLSSSHHPIVPSIIDLNRHPPLHKRDKPIIKPKIPPRTP